MKSWFNSVPDGIRLALYIQPGAKKTQLAGEHDGALKLRLAAPPVDGKANLALQNWLAERFDVPKRLVILLSGEKSRHKLVKVELAMALTFEQVLLKLSA